MPHEVQRPGSFRPWAGLAIIVLLPLAAVVAVGDSAGAHTPHDVIVDIAVSPAFSSDRTVLAISGNRVLRSTDGGIDFHETVIGLDSTFSMARFGFAPSKPSVVFLTSRGGGVYRSDDSGLHWAATTAAPAAANVAELAVSPQVPDVVVVVGGIFGTLVRTDDGGRTWSSVPGVSGVKSLTFVPGRDRRLVAVGSGGTIRISDDDGQSFSTRPGVAGASVITAVTAGPSGTLFAGNESGAVFRSEDGGDSWSRFGRALPGAPINSMLVSGTRRAPTVWASTWHRGVFRSPDQGTTWTDRSSGLTSDEQADTIRSPQFRSLAVAPLPGGGQRLFLAGYDGLFTSNDGGRKWREIQTQADYPTGLAVSPTFRSDHTVAVNTYVKGSFISRDGGDSFRPSDRGLTVAHVGEGNKVFPIRRMHNIVFSPDYAADRTIFTATWTAFVVSHDGGRTWNLVTVAPPPPDSPLRQFVIAVSPAYRDDHTIFLGTRDGALYRSTAGGAAGTWVTVANLGSWTRSLSLSPGFETDRTLFAGTERGVMKSTDAGRHWIQTGPTELALLAISPGFARDGTLFAGTRSGLQVTRDGGTTWAGTGLNAGPPARGVAAVAVSPDFSRDGVVLTSVDGTGLFRSRDRGRSFVPIAKGLLGRGLVIADFDRPTSSPIQFSPAFASDRTIFAYAQEAVLRSGDGGSRWVELPVPSAASFDGRVPLPDNRPSASGRGDTVAWAGAFIVAVGLAGAATVLVLRRRRRFAERSVG